MTSFNTRGIPSHIIHPRSSVMRKWLTFGLFLHTAAGCLFLLVVCCLFVCCFVDRTDISSVLISCNHEKSDVKKHTQKTGTINTTFKLPNSLHEPLVLP